MYSNILLGALMLNIYWWICEPTTLYFDKIETKSKNLGNYKNHLLKKKKKVMVFPVSEKSWIDIGQWVEYKKTIEKLN